MPMVVLTGEELGKASGEGDGISTKALSAETYIRLPVASIVPD
jgi:hypothetical protein